jgi:hypothetical protein
MQPGAALGGHQFDHGFIIPAKFCQRHTQAATQPGISPGQKSSLPPGRNCVTDPPHFQKNVAHHGVPSTFGRLQHDQLPNRHFGLSPLPGLLQYPDQEIQGSDMVGVVHQNLAAQGLRLDQVTPATQVLGLRQR